MLFVNAPAVICAISSFVNIGLSSSSFISFTVFQSSPAFFKPTDKLVTAPPIPVSTIPLPNVVSSPVSLNNLPDHLKALLSTSLVALPIERVVVFLNPFSASSFIPFSPISKADFAPIREILLAPAFAIFLVKRISNN